jgi:cytoskeletal protein RodZ
VGQFGDKFRKAREKKGISLDDASNVTKIGSRMLQAIEEEHFDLLPGGVFNKGFIRAYAKHLGINDQEAVTEYLECLRQEQIKAQAIWEPQPRPAAPEKRPVNAGQRGLQAQTPAHLDELPDLQLPRPEHVRPPHQKYLGRRDTRIPWRLLAATAVVMVLAVVLWRRHAISSAGNTASNLPVPATASTPAASTPAPSPPAASTPAAIAANTPSADRPNSAQSSAVQPGTVPPSNPATRPPTSANPPTQTASPAAAPAKAESDNTENDVTVRPLRPAAAAPAETPAPTLTLVIRATENSWISVSADGKSVSHETLIAPAHTSVRASREIVARVGNAAGVTFLWKGEEIPAQGAEAEVKTFVFDAQGMRVLNSTPAPAQNP